MNGYRLFYGLNSGPLLSVTYGPMAYILYLPVTIASTPTAALAIGNLLVLFYYFIPAGLVLLGPQPRRDGSKALRGICAFLCFGFATFLFPPLAVAVNLIYPDAPMLGLVLTACWLFDKATRSKREVDLALSVLCLVLAVWTKQIAVFCVLGFLFYTGVVYRPRLGSAFKWLMFWLLVVSGMMLGIFDFQGMYWNMMAFPGSRPWKLHYVESFFSLSKLLGFCLILPVGIMAGSLLCGWINRKNRSSFIEIIRVYPLTFLMVTMGLCMIPVSLLGAMKAGAGYNHLSYPLYFLTVASMKVLSGEVEAAGPESSPTGRKRLRSLLILALLLAVLQTRDWGEWNNALKLYDCNYHEVSYRYALNHRGSVYFPWNPLSTLLSEHRAYAYVPGIIERNLTGVFRVSDRHVRSCVPANLQRIALPEPSTIQTNSPIDIMEYFPEFSKRKSISELPG